MVKFYAVSLVIGLLGLLVVILGGGFAENVGRPERDPGEWMGAIGKTLIGALVGFGMGGLSAEFSPLDMGWQAALGVALIAATVSILWVRYSLSRTEV